METRLETCALCGAQIDLATGGCPYCLPAGETPAQPSDPEASPTPAPPAAPPTPPVVPPTPAPPTPPVAPPPAPLAFDDEAFFVPDRPPVGPPPLPPDVSSRSVTPPPLPATPPPIAPADAGAPLAGAAPTPGAAAVAPPRPAGPVEFEAEECLTRGDATRALVLVSKALTERPENLTLLALLERARKAVVRGKRGERLERRLREAQDLLAQGELAAADKIVGSALKIVPNHPMALDLFKRLRDARLAAPSAEAEAERELEHLGSAQARRALEQARTLRAQGNERGALIAVRRGLRVVPDDRELLTLFGEVEDRLGRLAATHTSFNARVHEARRRLMAGDTDGSRRILSEILREDPDYLPAKTALEEVRLAHLRRMTVTATPPPAKPAATSAAPPTPSAREPLPRPTTARPPLVSPPPEVMLPLTRRRATPLALIAIGALLLLGAALFALFHRTPEQPVTPQIVLGPADTGPATPAPGPLDGVDPSLRAAIEAALAAYGAALESGDAERLAAARPDLNAGPRETLLAPLRGALNVAIDLRLLALEGGADYATVRILRTAVIVGGTAEAPAPAEETLRFVWRDAGWTLR